MHAPHKHLNPICNAPTTTKQYWNRHALANACCGDALWRPKVICSHNNEHITYIPTKCYLRRTPLPSLLLLKPPCACLCPSPERFPSFAIDAIRQSCHYHRKHVADYWLVLHTLCGFHTAWRDTASAAAVPVSVLANRIKPLIPPAMGCCLPDGTSLCWWCLDLPQPGLWWEWDLLFRQCFWLWMNTGPGGREGESGKATWSTVWRKWLRAADLLWRMLRSGTWLFLKGG